MSRYVSPEILQNYPFFMNWLKELDRSPYDVTDFAVESEMREIEPNGLYKQFLPTDNYNAFLYFNNGDHFCHEGKFSEGKMNYVPVEDEKIEGDESECTA